MRRRARDRIFGVAGVVIALGSSSCGSLTPSAANAGAEQHPLLGATAPPFELPSADGKRRVSSESYAGRVVVVDFWATWCAPCRESFPVYQRLAEKYGSKLAVVGISVDEEPSGIQRFAKETGAKFTLLWDEGQIAAKSYDPPTMPTSYVLDQSGIVRFVHAGFRPDDEPRIDSELSSLLH